MIEQGTIRTNSHSISYTHFINNSESVVFLFHGFLSKKEDLYPLAEAISQSGMDVVLPDMYAHGESDGDIERFSISTVLKDFSILVKRISRKYKKWAVFGFSIGGYVAINMASLKPNCIVLGAPLLSFKDTFKHVDLKEWKKSNVLVDEQLGLSLKINYKFYEDGLSLDKNEWSSDVPVFVIHGENDEVIDISQVNHIRSPQEFVKLESGHNIFVDENTISLIVDWLKKCLLEKN